MQELPCSPCPQNSAGGINISLIRATEIGGFGPICSARRPELTTRVLEGGWQQTQVRVPGVGRSGAVSFYLGQSFQGAPEDDAPGLGMLVEIPAEELHLDYLVPQGWTEPGTARARSYANRHDVKGACECRGADLIPMHEQVQHFQSRETAPASPSIAHWPDVVRHVLKERGWWGKKFDVYRCVISHPMLQGGPAS